MEHANQRDIAEMKFAKKEDRGKQYKLFWVSMPYVNIKKQNIVLGSLYSSLAILRSFEKSFWKKN